MSSSFLSFASVSFRYTDSPTNLFSGITVSFPEGWTGIVGPNGAGKSTLLLLAAGLLTPSSGRVLAPGEALYCDQRTDDPPAALADLLCSDDAEAGELVSRLGIDDGWPGRWETLSYGERRRAQIGVALWRAPTVLCVDEPTNHLDLPSIECLTEALAACACGLLLASHDEVFLEDLTTRRWEITTEHGDDSLLTVRI